jgi:hypoxanthine phosphoribosyltransferase
MQSDLERVLFDEPAIRRRLDEMAAQISNDYRDRELTVIAILTGSLIFVADLLRRIPLPLKLDCLSVVSYHGKAQTSGKVIFKQVALPDLVGRDVLILDDILDSGHTLATICEKLQAAKPCSVRVCVLLSKKNNAPGMSMQIMLSSKLKMNLSSVTGSISWSAIATCLTSAC